MSRCFGEYLAEMAGEGCDLDAPVPHRRRADRFVAVYDHITLADAAADGARGDPATGGAEHGEKPAPEATPGRPTT